MGNIIHLVLARGCRTRRRAEGHQPFIVPGSSVDATATPANANGVRCGFDRTQDGHPRFRDLRDELRRGAGLAGRRGRTRGLVAMFVMMNTARLAVGLQGLGLADRALQNALRYARERLRVARSLTGREIPGQAGDPDHRSRTWCMPLTQRRWSRAAACSATTPPRWSMSSAARRTPARRRRRRAARLPSPHRQGLPDRMGRGMHLPRAAVLGGHGYIPNARHGTAGARCAHHHLYEGTTGIQALDLMGRKTPAGAGRGSARSWHGRGVLPGAAGDAALAEFIAPAA